MSIVGLLALIPDSAWPAALDGSALYAMRCAGCHENAIGRIPTRAALRETAPESIIGALTNGTMMFQASGMSREEIRTVAAFLSAKPFGAPQAAQTQPNPCPKPAGALQITAQHWNGWGRDLQNTRYQPDPGLRSGDVPRLKVKWAYAYAGRFAQGQPTLIGDRLFVSNTLGEVSALDARTGCEHWTFKAATSVKVALTAGSIGTTSAVFFGDERSAVYAVNADTGALIWKTIVDTHTVSRIVGGSLLHEGRLYVPVSAAEEGAARDPAYQCCTFRGSVVAMNAADGSVIWKTHAILGEPKPLKLNSAGTQMFGPAGAAIWSAPTLDVKRGLIYVGTGNSYTEAETDGSNAIVAFDLKTGTRRWAYQATARDNFVLGCGKGETKGNCPKEVGGDVDFGASPILQTLANGKQIIVAGQKSGVVHALDPDNNGKLLWKAKVGQGSPLGGIEWGPAVDAKNIYVAVADAGAREGSSPGLTALNAVDGARLWHVPTPTVVCSWDKETRCARGQPAAVTVIPGIVFSGALDGHIRAYDTKDGNIVWDFDTAKAIAVINGPVTEGGSIDQAGPTIANGMLYVNSGYGRWGKPGRLLLAFSVDGK